MGASQVLSHLFLKYLSEHIRLLLVAFVHFHHPIKETLFTKEGNLSKAAAAKQH